MNKTYKVRATRTGALQVVSELTSSVAAIGTKTVVAVATTMVAGAAIAAIPAAPTEGEGNVINDKAITWDLVEADANQNFVYNAASTQESGDDFLTATEKKAFGKTMWVVAEKGEYATGIYAVGTGVTATNTGTIYVQGKVDAAGSASSWQLHGMGAGNGATSVNVGTIEVENAYGMYVGNSDSTDNETKPTIINNGTIRVYKQGVGMELGGVTKSTAENNGTIEVVSAEEVNKGTWAHGVLIKDQAEATFTNTGTITATAANTSAIEIQTDEMSVNATVNLEGSSAIDGLIKISSKDTSNVATVELNAKGVTDTFKLKADASSNVTLNILDGANVTLEDGQDSTIDEANIENGTLTASIFQADNAFTTVNLEEKGVFNITKLNSKTTADATDNDRLLLAYNSTYNLNGGRLAVAGQTYTGDIRVGTNPSKSENKGTGTIDVNAGSYTFGMMEVRNTGAVNVKGGELTVNALDISKLGTVTVDGGTMRVNGALTIASAGTSGRLTLNNGTFETAASNVYAASQTAHQFTKTDAWNKVSLDDSADIDLVLNGVGEYDIDDYTALQTLVGDASKVNLVLNGTFKPAEDATIGSMVGNAGANDTISIGGELTEAGAVTVTLEKDVGVGALGVETGTKTVTLTNTNKTLSLAGQNGTVLSQSVETLDVAGTLALGILSTDSATVNAETVKAGTLEVNGDFTAQNVTLTGTSTVSTVGQGAKLVLDTLSATNGGTMTVEGAMAVTNVAANVTVTEGGELVLTEAGEGDAGISGTITAGGITIGTKSTGRSMSVFSLTDTTAEGITWLTVSKDPRATAKSVISASAFTDEDFDGIRTIYYADATTKLSGSTNEVKIGADSAIVINAQAFSDTKAVIEGGVLTIDGGKGFLLNAGQTGSILVSETAGGSTGTLTTDNFFVTATLGTVDGKTGTYITTSFKNTVFGDDQELAAAVEAGMNRDTANIAVFRAIGDTYRDTAGTALTEDGLLAASEYVAAPVVAGTYNVAYDAAAEVTRAVMNHNVKGEGMGAWADVFYASNEAKKIYGGQGYSADVYGGVFGFDTVFSCGAKLGAALTIGQADADGERSFSKYSNDADFWGLSVYTGKNVADTSLYIGADLSYLWVDNDLKGTVAGASADESLDSTVFTVGLRADWTAYEGAFNVVPHAGVRYTAIDVDDYRGYASDSINVVELPVGVEVNGTFEASGWKVVPSVDFTIVPQVGDKDVKTAVGNVDVIDNLYNTTVGVEAVYGQYAFGLDAGYGFGTDDRQNATVKANFSYRF